MYYSERLVLTALFLLWVFIFSVYFFRGIHSFSAEILIWHSEMYFPSAVLPKQVFVNVLQREAHSECHTVLQD